MSSNQLKKIVMKKVFYSFVAAAMFAGVVACGQTEEAAPVEEAVEVVEEEVAPVEEVVDSAAAVATEEAAPAVEAAPAQ